MCVCGESVWGGGKNKESYSQQRGYTVCACVLCVVRVCGVGGTTRKAILNNVDTPCVLCVVRVCGVGGRTRKQRGHTHILFERLSECVWLKTEEAV